MLSVGFELNGKKYLVKFTAKGYEVVYRNIYQSFQWDECCELTAEIAEMAEKTIYEAYQNSYYFQLKYKVVKGGIDNFYQDVYQKAA